MLPYSAAFHALKQHSALQLRVSELSHKKHFSDDRGYSFLRVLLLQSLKRTKKKKRYLVISMSIGLTTGDWSCLMLQSSYSPLFKAVLNPMSLAV